MSDLVGNPEDRFSYDAAQIHVEQTRRVLYSLRERLRTQKVFTKDQCFYLNYLISP